MAEIMFETAHNKGLIRTQPKTKAAQYLQGEIISGVSPLEGDGKHLWLSTDPHL